LKARAWTPNGKKYYLRATLFTVDQVGG
jgi:hypothetical protein